MAQLYFNFSTMNAGKSTSLLQCNHNYKELGMTTMLFTFAGDDRYGIGKITSRIGLEADASLFDKDTDLLSSVYNSSEEKLPDCVLIDEAQFLTKDQIEQLSTLVDYYNVPVMCYGLRTDFQGNLFEGSASLFAAADKLVEMKTLCRCGSKATHVVRIDKDGVIVKTGDQIQIGGNDSYISVCRRHFS
jgi:thymidine kinase